MNEVYETLGDDGVNMSDDDLADLIRECNYKTDLTIDKILARNGAQPDGKNFQLQILINILYHYNNDMNTNMTITFNLTFEFFANFFAFQFAAIWRG